jgi:hypothetical protein
MRMTMRMAAKRRKRARTKGSPNGSKTLNRIIHAISILVKLVSFSLLVLTTNLRWPIKAYGV